MSNEALHWAWAQRVGDPEAKLLLIRLADQANSDGECWPGRESLAGACEVSDSTVKRRLALLQELELLEVRPRRRDNGTRTSNLYVLGLGSHVTRGQRLTADPHHGSHVDRQEPKEEPSTALSDESARSPRGHVYDALCTTYFPEGSTPTGREARKTGIAASNIHAAGGRAEDVPVRAAKLAKVMPPGTTLTPMALASNWALAAAPAAAADPGCPYCLMRGGQHSSECEAVRPAAEDGAP